MGKGKGKGKKKDDGLPEGFAEAVAGMSTDEIRRKLSDIILLDIAMHDMMDADDKYQQAKAAYEELAAPYKEDFKSFKQQIKCCKRILDDKNGGAISAKLEEDHIAAKEAKRTSGLRESTRESNYGDAKVTVSVDGQKVGPPISMAQFQDNVRRINENIKGGE
jgi:hypothetical protein